VPGLEAAQPLSNIEALELAYVPPHLIVLGGGYVGLELGQAYHRFGSRVTVIERGPQLMSREDPDVSEEVQRILSDEGIHFFVGAEVFHVHGRSGEQVILVVRTTAGERHIEGTDILVAAGRTPNTAGIGLEVAGVGLDSRGYIRVNERLERSAAGVWALGECAGSPQFTHVAGDDFRIVRDNLAGAQRSTRDRLVPYCMFTEPPLARVGLTEGDARRQGVTVRVAGLPTSAVLRTETTDETQGLMKALVGGSDDRILGFAMIGAEAGEVLAPVQTAMLADLPYPKLRDAILAHPTMAEGARLAVRECAAAVCPTGHAATGIGNLMRACDTARGTSARDASRFLQSENPVPHLWSRSRQPSAIDTTTRAMSKQLGPRHIRVNTVAPGQTETKGTHRIGLVGSPEGAAGNSGDSIGRSFRSATRDCSRSSVSRVGRRGIANG
jgi:NADPH-dependent 2,4-dienoyl-CoA reductase/sulfur reductase-like enzyme